MRLTATEALLAAVRAVDDTTRTSRFRHRAERRWWAREERAREVASRYRHQIIVEAAERVAARTRPLQAWHRPDVGDVLDELRQFGNYLPETRESIARVIYRDSTLSLNGADFTLVRDHAAALPDHIFTVLHRRCYASKPGTLGRSGVENDAELVTALSSRHARLSRPVTLYRGEHRQSRHDEFARAADAARPGDLLTQRRHPISASIDPSIAAQSEFAPGGHLADDRSNHSPSWLLEITTDRLLYAGDRAERSGISDGLAAFEKEAVIHVPQLRVQEHREALVRSGPRGAFKRLHVIACTPVNEDPHTTGAPNHHD